MKQRPLAGSIGYVGSSGKACVGPYHVRFGISHPTAPGDWMVRQGEMRPCGYLRAWEAGTDVMSRSVELTHDRCTHVYGCTSRGRLDPAQPIRRYNIREVT